MTTKEKTALLRYQLVTLNESYGVTISFIAKESGIGVQHLNSFKNKQLTFGWKRLTVLDIFLKERYAPLLNRKGEF